jgi:FkbM family methyltransferase
MIKTWVKQTFAALGFDLMRRTATARPQHIESELLRLRNLPPGTPTETTILGRRLQIPCPRTFEYLYAEIWERGIYRLPENLKAPRVIDGGANIGLATLFVKSQFPDARVTAVEPDPEIAAMLRANLTEFGLDDVEVVNAALSEYAGSVSFVRDRSGTAGRISNEENAFRVDSIQLSTLMDRGIDFLKLDIEGAEVGVLREAAHRLDCVESLFLEFHSYERKPQDLSEVLGYLERAGFRYVLETGGPKAARPFVSRTVHKGMDNLINIYAFRR